MDRTRQTGVGFSTRSSHVRRRAAFHVVLKTGQNCEQDRTGNERSSHHLPEALLSGKTVTGELSQICHSQDEQNSNPFSASHSKVIAIPDLLQKRTERILPKLCQV